MNADDEPSRQSGIATDSRPWTGRPGRIRLCIIDSVCRLPDVNPRALQTGTTAATDKEPGHRRDLRGIACVRRVDGSSPGTLCLQRHPSHRGNALRHIFCRLGQRQSAHDGAGHVICADPGSRCRRSGDRGQTEHDARHWHSHRGLGQQRFKRFVPRSANPRSKSSSLSSRQSRGRPLDCPARQR